MRVRCSSLLLIVAIELLVLTEMLPIVRAVRYAQQRASCVNGLAQQSPTAAASSRD
jgi:hypothetical protein